jgi:hypothetical protein
VEGNSGVGCTGEWYVGETPGLTTPHYGVTTVNGDVMVRDGGTLHFDVGTADNLTRDKLSVTGTASLSDTGTSTLSVTRHGTATGLNWDIISATGGFNSTEFTAFSLPTGMTHSKPDNNTYRVSL